MCSLMRALGGVGAMLRWLRGFYRRVVPAWEEEFPRVGSGRVGAGGAFEWEPAGAPRIQVRHGLVHRWWDAERGPRFEAALSFEVPDEVAPALLARATRAGLRRATAALPARGKVHAQGAVRDEPGPKSLVRVALRVQGSGATPEWARVASEAFARAFLARIEDARRR